MGAQEDAILGTRELTPGFPPRSLLVEVPGPAWLKLLFYLIKLTAHLVHVLLGGRHQQGYLIRAKFSDKLCEAADP